MEKVEWEDVQGLLLSGYPRLPFSAYVLWRFRSQRLSATKQWLQVLADRLMRVGGNSGRESSSLAVPQWPTSIKALKHAKSQELRAVNLALTSRGLQQLEVGPDILKNFSFEFLEGMAPRPDNDRETPRRTNVLGDLGDSSPASWDWGGWNANSDIDGVLLLFAANESSLQSLVDDEIGAMSAAAEPIRIATQDGYDSPLLKGQIYADRKEHFGYTDGISQPIIEGSPRAERGEHADGDKRIHFVKPGEFVLGYHNERRMRAVGTERVQDLRRNGTYLVFRQLEQNVGAFNDFVAAAAAQMQLDTDAENRKLVAGKLVGRYPDGEPLVPAAAGSKNDSGRNDFLYYFQDRFGLDCPVGAHIRRSSPRDSNGPDPETALRLSKMHRIIRRSRIYGERLDPIKGDAASDKGRRGILFICLNADIAGQFEMIQHSWLNNRHFGDQYVGTDPLGHFAGDGGTITIQRRPINLVLERPQPFVRVRGGAYFFMPGIAAVRAMSV